MPAHSFHLLQSLDIDYFNPLKKAYNAEIEHLIRVYIIYISKKNFFPVFKIVFNAIITKLNIKFILNLY